MTSGSYDSAISITGCPEGIGTNKYIIRHQFFQSEKASPEILRMADGLVMAFIKS
jgi:hypothetical protein